jgi:3-hydroxyisobutyrate dehydrogenase-like beta-hydroxyacid dehydrogenase
LADVGLIGLAVMGENLALNMESRGFRVAVFNRTIERVDEFVQGQVRGANFDGASFLNGADLSASLNWNLASWNGALFDSTTVLPAGFDPVAAGMVFVAEPHTTAMLGLGLLGLGVAGRRPRQK